MDDKQRLQLANMIKTNNVEDQTDLIRNLKHSQILRNEINNMIIIKAKYRNDDARISEECINECGFLYTYYTDIFNKVIKEELNMEMMVRFIFILKQIEDGIIDQYDASVKVGTILKDMYVDSAMRRGENLDKQHQAEAPTFVEPVKMSWSEFKTKNK
jgi:hypothetical protein